MKSTQKFLFYSLFLTGAALVFSIGCKKTTIGPATYPNVAPAFKPVLNTGSSNPLLAGATSNTINATDWVASTGSTSVTAVGFYFMAVGSVSGGATPTMFPATASMTNTSSWASITGTTVQIGAFSTSLGAITPTGLTTTAIAALSGSTTVTWYVQSFATNGNGTTTSALTQTIQTTN
jgi:hypothetical protein